MSSNHTSPAQRDWSRLLQELEKHPAGQWRILGLLGDSDPHPNLLHKLYVHSGGHAKWWVGDFEVVQTQIDPVAYRASIPKRNALSADRVVEGNASLLLKLTCDPRKRGLVKMLAEFHRRLSS
jgi:hypothetical protein